MESALAFELNPVELRVLGAMIEKEITTPDYYPLTLNALVAACNQKSNRDPVMALAADQVQKALASLRDKRMALQVMTPEERVPKYRQSWTAVAGLTPDEKAVMAELLLRGPQTLGELRGRCARMHEFADLNEVQLTLDGLMEREDGALVMLMPRQAGFKERRYAHLLGGPLAAEDAASDSLAEPDASPAIPSAPARPSELEALRAEVADLRETLADLQRQFQDFRRQFE